MHLIHYNLKMWGQSTKKSTAHQISPGRLMPAFNQFRQGRDTRRTVRPDRAPGVLNKESLSWSTMPTVEIPASAAYTTDEYRLFIGIVIDLHRTRSQRRKCLSVHMTAMSAPCNVRAHDDHGAWTCSHQQPYADSHHESRP